MEVKNLSKEIRDCLDKMNKAESSLEKAYAEENDILIKKFLSELEELNTNYASLRHERDALLK